MTIPFKKLASLILPPHRVEVRSAALVVVGELACKDLTIHDAVLKALEDDDETIRMAAVAVAGQVQLSQAVPILLDRVKHGGEESRLAAHSLAKLGMSAVRKLHDLMGQVAPGVRKTIAVALATAGGRSSQADHGVAMLLEPDLPVAMASATALITQIPTMQQSQKAKLAEELTAILGDTKQKPSHELPILKVLAALNCEASTAIFWERTLPSTSPDVRALALNAVGGWVKTPTKDQWQRLFSCAADRDFRVAAPALVILSRLCTTARQVPQWLALLQAPDATARKLALEKLAETDTPEVADAIFQQLRHPDRTLRDASRKLLLEHRAGRALLLSKLLEDLPSEPLWDLVRLATPLAKQIDDKSRQAVLHQAISYLEANDHRSDPLLSFLREGNPEQLRDAITNQALTRRKAKKYEVALQSLRWLARDPSIGWSVRLELALVGLKLSTKNLAAEARASDLCLRNFSSAVQQNHADTLKTIQKTSWITLEELFYVGFHFAEHTGQEREFGVALLQAVVKAAPRNKLGATAKNKLKSLGALK